MDKHFKTKFLRGSTFSMTGTFLMLVLHFMSMKVLAEYMPLEEFGIFALLMVISQGFVVAGGLGMGLTLVRELSAAQGRRRQQQLVTGVVLVRSIQLALLSAIVCTLGPIVLPRLFGVTIGDYVFYLPAMFCLAIFRETFFNVLQGREQFHWYAITKVLSAATRLSAILLLAHLARLGVQELIWVEIVTTATTVFVLFSLTHTISSPRLTMVRPGNLKRVLRFSAPLFANDVFTYFYNGATVLLLGALLSSSSVALFAVASKIPDAMQRLFLSMSIVYFPTMSQLMASGRRKEGEQLMNVALVLITAGLSFVALLTFFFQEEIMVILFSEQYIKAAPVLALLMLSFILNCTGQLMGFTSVAEGHASLPLRINVVTSIINFCACLGLIPLWGVLGAVAAQLVANSAMQVLYWQQLNRTHLVIVVRDIVKPLLLGFAILALYEISGCHYRLVRIALLGAFIALCWFLVPGVRRSFEFGFRHFVESRTQPSRAG